MNRCCLLLIIVSLSAGCQTGPISRMLARKDQTTYRTPTVRSNEAIALAAKSTGEESAEQQEILNELARRIQSESDPLVRETLIQSIASFPMPLADQVLEAGLRDSDAGVRQQCCRSLGSRGRPASAAALAQVIRNEEDLDVRLAATQALGNIQSPEAAQALVAALEDNSPAMQYAGVQAMRGATGKDFGGDVSAYLAYARGEEAPMVATKPEPTSGNFLRRLSPF